MFIITQLFLTTTCNSVLTKEIIHSFMRLTSKDLSWNKSKLHLPAIRLAFHAVKNRNSLSKDIRSSTNLRAILITFLLLHCIAFYITFYIFVFIMQYVLILLSFMYYICNNNFFCIEFWRCIGMYLVQCI